MKLREKSLHRAAAADSLLLQAGKQDYCCCWLAERLLLVVWLCCCWCGCAAAGASRAAAVDSWCDLPGLISFLAVSHARQAYNTPQIYSKYRHAGRRQSNGPRDALERAPTRGGGRSTTGCASAGRGQDSGVSASTTQERENETETEIV